MFLVLFWDSEEEEREDILILCLSWKVTEAARLKAPG
jgi:hypothetical protein